MDSISSYRMFVQVAETRSFVATGRLLGISASAVGKAMARLETSLSVRLFHRSPRSVALTAEGTFLLEKCRRFLQEIDGARDELLKGVEAPRGKLRVSLPLVGAPFLPVIARFSQEYPEVQLDLEFSDRSVDVIEEGFDAVIRVGDAADSRLTTKLLGTFNMMLVGSPEYFARRGTPKTTSDLAGHSCIQFRYPRTGKLQMWPIEREEIETPLRTPPSIVCNNTEARICFAQQGAGIAYLPDFAIRDLLASGELVSILDDYTERDQFRIIWPSGRNAPPKLRVFIDFLSERLFPTA